MPSRQKHLVINIPYYSRVDELMDHVLYQSKLELCKFNYVLVSY